MIGIHRPKQEADALYEQYGKPLEQEHHGEYVAISRQGAIVLGATLLDVMQKANATLGQESFIFRVGQRSVGNWR